MYNNEYLLTKEEQDIIREVFKYKLDEIDKAIEDLKDFPYINYDYKKLMKQPLLEEKGKYISLQNKIINKIKTE